MKKTSIVGFFVVVAMIFAFMAGVTVSGSGKRFQTRALSAASPMERDEGGMGYAMDAPAAPPPEAMAEGKMDRRERMKEEVAQKGLLKALSGAAPGGSIADALGGDQQGIGGLGLRGGGKGGGGSGYGAGLAGPKRAPAKSKARADVAEEAENLEGGESGGEAPTRAWFPETFLFEPLVVTDANGKANVPVKVPDRLTTWHVLALAHSRQGGQAGAVADFLGTLPTYVDPVVPPFLYSGDTVRLPVQVVNTTDGALASALSYQAVGATLSTAGGKVKVPAFGNTVDFVTLSTSKPGTAQVKAVLGDTDAVVRSIDVKPPGKRELVSRGGSLAAPRSFTLHGPENAIAGSESVAVQVYPGALGFLRTELSAAPGRGGVAEDGYLLQLLGKAPGLLHALGGEPATDTIRDLTVLATQRVMRHARSPSTDSATLLAEAALAHPDNAILSRLGERLAMQLQREQRPDGSCQGADGWTLQRLLVTTSECVRAAKASTLTPAAKQRATAVTIKATGFFERNLARINDGYTAAAILASGGVSGEMAKKLQALVLAGLVKTDDGAQYLKVEPGVVRADGATPSTSEATALAVLALKGVDQAPLADLGTWLLGGYSMYVGWGDGRANQVCLRAVTELFKDPLPASVHLVLERDGAAMVEGSFDAAKLKQVVTLDADAKGSSGAHTWSIRAEPPVPGLGFALGLVAYVPWKDELGGGLELTSKLPAAMKVGAPVDVELTVAAPSSVATRLSVGLPAGVQPDGPALDALVSAGQVQRYETEDGAVTLHLPGLSAGATHHFSLRVVPTLAGSLQAGPSRLEPEGNPMAGHAFAPKLWAVK